MNEQQKILTRHLWQLTTVHLKGESTRVDKSVVDATAQMIQSFICFPPSPYERKYDPEWTNPSHPDYLAKGLRCFGQLMQAGMNAVFPVVVYEAMCWYGPSLEPNELPVQLVAEVIGQYGSYAYHIVESFLTWGVDPLSRRTLQNAAIRSYRSLDFRCRITIVASLAALARSEYDERIAGWPPKRDVVIEWAEKRLRDVPDQLRGVDELVAEEAEKWVAYLDRRSKRG